MNEGWTAPAVMIGYVHVTVPHGTPSCPPPGQATGFARQLGKYPGLPLHIQRHKRDCRIAARPT